MREVHHDIDRLKARLGESGASEAFANRLLHVFDLINRNLKSGFGHSHFWNTRDEADFRALWQSRILFLLRREFQFDEAGLEDLKQEVEKVFPNKPVSDGDAEVPETTDDGTGVVEEAPDAT